VHNQTSAWADQKVQEIKRLIFPLHGLPS
jgi:hypothetical protein